MLAGGDAGVDFDADFGVGSEREMLAGVAEEILDLGGREIGGSAAAPMKLNDGTLAGDVLTDAGQFALQDFKVGRGHGMILLDDDVAGAEKAEAFAEWDMHVKRYGRFCEIGFGMNFFQVGGAEGVIPDGGGGIAGVAGAGTIVTGEKFFADAKFFAGLSQVGIRQGHDVIPRSVPHAVGLAGARPTRFSLHAFPSGMGFLQQNLLAGFDKELGIFYRRMLQNTVAEVKDVAGAAECRGGFQSYAANFFGRGEKDGGVDVSLQGDVGAELRAKVAHVNAPIDTQNVCAGTGNGGEKMMRSLGVIDDRRGSREGRDDFLEGWESEVFVVAEGEFAAPGVE